MLMRNDENIKWVEEMLTIDSFPNRYIIAAVRILMIHMQLCVHGLYINYKKKAI